MSELSTAELTEMRATAQRLMPETWTLQRGTPTPDGQGGQTVTYATVASGSEAEGNGARLSPAGYQAAERLIAERLGTTDLWRVTLPQGTVVRGGDHVIINARTFQVVGISGPHTFDAALTLTCVEVL